ncbi:DUF4283 domain protein [Sesbania bispinosa]|nr:DUF4283 domain protein [Sesbania bispinosa]
MAHVSDINMEPDPLDEVIASNPVRTSFKDKLLGSKGSGQKQQADRHNDVDDQISNQGIGGIQGVEENIHHNKNEDAIHGEWMVVSRSKKPGSAKGKGKDQINSKNKGISQSKAHVSKNNQFSALSNIQHDGNENEVNSIKEGKDKLAIVKNTRKDFGIKTAMNVEVISQNRMRFVDMNDQDKVDVEDNSELQLKGLKSPSNQDSPEVEFDPMLEVLDKTIGIQPPQG